MFIYICLESRDVSPLYTDARLHKNAEQDGNAGLVARNLLTLPDDLRESAWCEAFGSINVDIFSGEWFDGDDDEFLVALIRVIADHYSRSLKMY